MAQTNKVSSSPHIVPLFINGAHVNTGNIHPVVNPVDGKELWSFVGASVEDANRAVEAAREAFPAWAATHLNKRSAILTRAAELMAARSDELKEYMKTETAADPTFADFVVGGSIDELKDIARRAPSIHGTFPPVDDSNRSAIILKEPYGVVVGIAPWNAPYALGTRAISAALATGNTCVLKGSELSPRCFAAIVDSFHEAGLPKGCLNLVHTTPQSAPEVVEALIRHPATAKISFTGSTAVGRIVASTAGKYLKPTILELGGKSSVIVLADANLQKAALACVIGAFSHSGQVCMGTERILVHSSVLSAFTEQLQATMNLVFSNPASAPNPISAQGRDKVLTLIDDALGKGATTLCKVELDVPKTRLLPVVLGNITKEMGIFYQESFGPVATIHPFDTEEEAIALVNDNEYGLAGSIFTENLQAGLRLAKKYTTGAVHINSMTIHDESNLPHGGTKNSGYGKFNAEEGLNEFLRTKSITWEN